MLSVVSKEEEDHLRQGWFHKEKSMWINIVAMCMAFDKELLAYG